MVATQFTRTERRALRWIDRRGSGLQPSEPAFQLLGERLSVRWRAGLAAYLPLFGFLALWIWWSPATGTRLPIVEAVLLSLVPVAVFGVAQIGFVQLCRWSDRRIASRLPHRVSRPQAVAVRTVLGRLASALLVAAGIAHVVIVAVLFRSGPRADALAYLVGILVISGIVALTLRQVVRRPTIAVDPTALAVDERLRATDALLALWPVFWSAFGLTAPFGQRGAGLPDLVLWSSTALAIASGFVWFSHPDARAKYGRGGIWGPV